MYVSSENENTIRILINLHIIHVGQEIILSMHVRLIL